MPSERLQVILELITGQYKREAREAATATGGIGDAAVRASGGTSKLTGSLGGMAGAFKVVAGAAAAVAVADFARDSIMAASDLEESMNAVNVVFGDAADAIHEFGETSVDSVGLAAVNVNKSATVLGSALINVGLSAEEAAEKTIELTTRAADMASVFNTTVPEALEAIQSALRGETDPIEKFGVSLSAAAVDAEAAALGYEKVAGQFGATEKAAARMSLIMKQTDRVAGDFENTADSTANTIKRLNERLLETKARVGQALMPAFAALLEVADDLGPVFEDMAVEIANVVSEIAPLITGLGQIAGSLGVLREKGDEWEDSNNGLVASFGRFVNDLSFLDVLTANYGTHMAEAADASLELSDQTKGLTDKFKAAADRALFMADATKDDLVTAMIAAQTPTERLGTVLKGAGDRANAAAEGIRNVRLAALELASPVFAAAAAAERLRDAQEELNTVLGDSKATSEDVAQAQLDFAAALIEAQGAAEGLRGGNLAGALDLIATALHISVEEAEALLEQLGILDGKTVTTYVNVQTTVRGDGSDRVNVGTPGNRRASGGPVSANQMYMVGERGPEMFVSGQSGSIISNDTLRGLGSSVNIQVQSPMNDFHTDLQYAAVIASVVNLVE